MTSWEEYSDAALITYAESHRDFTVPPAMEMNRRLMIAVRAASDSADKFAAQAQNLNTSIRAYTIAMFALAAIEFLFRFWRG
jgi:hypothetical protein